jgi:hypothetical protein
MIGLLHMQRLMGTLRLTLLVLISKMWTWSCWALETKGACGPGCCCD